MVNRQNPNIGWIQEKECGYITASWHSKLMVAYQDIGRMLGAMISKPETFCKKQ